jgi:hypothetical protein
MDLLELAVLCAARHVNKKSEIVDAGLSILQGTVANKGLEPQAMMKVDSLVTSGHLRREKGGYTLTDSGKEAIALGLQLTSRVQEALRFE